MMRNLFLLLAIISFQKFANGQTEIVKWTFPTGQLTDTVQNSTNPLNQTSAIRSAGTTAITMTNGQTTGDYAATATGWDNGVDSKNWYISFKTTGYNNVKISSKQRAGGTNGGPIDFKLQYKIGSAGIWADITGGTITIGNNWTTGVIANLDLPVECQNQSEFVYLRWIMTSNNNVGGGTVAANGISKIDEIIFSGNVITGIENQEISDDFTIGTNAENRNIFIYSKQESLNAMVSVFSITGSILLQQKLASSTTTLKTDLLNRGIYILAIRSENKIITKKIVLE